MNWQHVLLLFLSGFLAVIITHFLLRNRKKKKPKKSTVSFIIFAVLLFIFKILLDPYFMSYENKKRADTTLQSVEAFQVIKHYAPEEYEALIRRITDEQTIYKPPFWILERARDNLAVLLGEYLPNAPDTSIIYFFEMLISTIDALNTLNPNECYNYLFNPKELDMTTWSSLADDIKINSTNAIAIVVASASENPQPIPERSDIQDDLDFVLAELDFTYGDDVGLMQGTQTENLEDRGKACIITRDFYKTILTLSEDRAGKLGRFLFNAVMN